MIVSTIFFLKPKQDLDDFGWYVKIDREVITDVDQVLAVMEMNDQWILDNCECILTLPDPEDYPHDCLFYVCGENLKLLSKLNDDLQGAINDG